MIVVTGSFDGFHRGHMKLLTAARDMAAEYGREGDGGVVTFDPHPRLFLGTVKAQLFTRTERGAIASALGIPHVITLKFDERLRALSPERFWEELKSSVRNEGSALSGAVMGKDFTFGMGAAGRPCDVESYCRAEGLPSMVLDLAVSGENGVRYSSTAARNAVSSGDMRGAAAILGYPWFVISRVVSGNRRGREIGFPTANLELDGKRLLPPDGVYAGAARVRDMLRPAAVSVGNNPTFGDISRPRVEVYITDFSGDIYGEYITVSFTERIRGMCRFDSPEALSAQIAEDVETCRGIFRGEKTENNDRYPLPPKLA